MKVFTLENEYICMKVTNIGCRILELFVPDKKGQRRDIILGLATDVAFFTVLQQQMLYDLKKYGEKNNINELKNLKLGRYTHLDHSLHLYERHFELVDEMLKCDFINVEMPVLDYPLVMFDENKVVPSHLTKAFINRIVNGEILKGWEIQHLSTSKFYLALSQWLDIH